jgi:hypothetical protein
MVADGIDGHRGDDGFASSLTKLVFSDKNTCKVRLWQTRWTCYFPGPGTACCPNSYLFPRRDDFFSWSLANIDPGTSQRLARRFSDSPAGPSQTSTDVPFQGIAGTIRGRKNKKELIHALSLLRDSTVLEISILSAQTRLNEIASLSESCLFRGESASRMDSLFT